jgi:hypothetical protein
MLIELVDNLRIQVLDAPDIVLLFLPWMVDPNVRPEVLVKREPERPGDVLQVRNVLPGNVLP